MSLTGTGAIKRKPKVDVTGFTTYIKELKDEIDSDTSIKAKTKINLNTLLNKLGDYNATNIYKEYLKIVDKTTNISSKYSILQRFSSISKKTKLGNILTVANKNYIQNEIKKYNDLINEERAKRMPNTKTKANKVEWKDLDELVGKLHGMDKLVLALYIYQPPMRADYNSVRIIDDDAEIDNDKENYYNVETNQFTILEFKNCEKFEPIVFFADDRVAKIISKSLKETPRKYLIYPYVTGKKSLINDNVSPNYLSHRISQITKENLTHTNADGQVVGKDIGINQLRKYFVAENNLDTISHAEVAENAKRMCHTIKTAQDNYYKHF